MTFRPASDGVTNTLAKVLGANDMPRLQLVKPSWFHKTTAVTPENATHQQVPKYNWGFARSGEEFCFVPDDSQVAIKLFVKKRFEKRLRAPPIFQEMYNNRGGVYAAGIVFGNAHVLNFHLERVL